MAVDIAPLAYLCREVGGDRVEVETLVPPGSSPHTFELTTGQMRFLSDADVLVTVGLGLTPWTDGIFEMADNPDLVSVTAGEVVPEEMLISATEAIFLEESSREEEHVHGGSEDIGGHAEGEECAHGAHDPHIWLDPILCEYIVREVGEALARADRDNASNYAANAEACVTGLRALDDEIEDELAEVSSRRFIAFHSSLTYFARRYGLEQVGVIEKLPGKEPSAGEIAGLVQRARALGVRAVFAERQFSPRSAQAVADASGGGVRVTMINPLEDPGDPDHGTYGGLMRELARAVKWALR